MVEAVIMWRQHTSLSQPHFCNSACPQHLIITLVCWGSLHTMDLPNPGQSPSRKWRGYLPQKKSWGVHRCNSEAMEEGEGSLCFSPSSWASEDLHFSGEKNKHPPAKKKNPQTKLNKPNKISLMCKRSPALGYILPQEQRPGKTMLCIRQLLLCMFPLCTRDVCPRHTR